ncbi:hypothetical protein WJM97_09650 [Okeanomitos corallinicola TIOX110]|uniref:Uncharacterized protein n=1 Tax=Okeanomitos corallinicola TIOX110 TaxID=3133117 RepID=A0ABZ2UWZ8_9CYAN
MMIKVIKSLFALFLVTCLVFLSPVIKVVSANNESNSPQVIFTSTRENTTDTINISVGDLTPQERQKMQAVRQRRNKEIVAVLDDSQLHNFGHYLHRGKDLNQALEELELSSEQRNLINAIIDFTNLKLQGIFDDHVLLDGHK